MSNYPQKREKKNILLSLDLIKACALQFILEISLIELKNKVLRENLNNREAQVEKYCFIWTK